MQLFGRLRVGNSTNYKNHNQIKLYMARKRCINPLMIIRVKNVKLYHPLLWNEWRVLFVLMCCTHGLKLFSGVKFVFACIMFQLANCDIFPCHMSIFRFLEFRDLLIKRKKKVLPHMVHSEKVSSTFLYSNSSRVRVQCKVRLAETLQGTLRRQRMNTEYIVVC